MSNTLDMLFKINFTRQIMKTVIDVKHTIVTVFD